MKFLNVARRFGAARYAAVGTAFLIPGVSMASSGPDFSSLTSGIDMSSVITAILAAAGILIGVLVAKKGAHLIMGFFGR